MILVEEARTVTQHSLERTINTRLHDLRHEAYRTAQVRVARTGRTSRLAIWLRALAERCERPRQHEGPWQEDFRHTTAGA